MACAECGSDGATRVRVEYVESATETLRLCEGCIEEFDDGDFVTDVTAVSSGDDPT